MFWNLAEGWHPHSRAAVTRWGLAEFRLATSFRGPRGERITIWVARLTAKGVQFRDHCHIRAAQRHDRELRRAGGDDRP